MSETYPQADAERRDRHRTAYREGRAAAVSGAGRDACPHDGSMAEHWRDGWDDETHGIEVSTW